MAQLSRLYSKRIFGTDINIALLRPDGVSRNGHSFDDAVRIAFENTSVHECPGVAFVGITEDILHIAR